MIVAVERQTDIGYRVGPGTREAQEDTRERTVFYTGLSELWEGA